MQRFINKQMTSRDNLLGMITLDEEVINVSTDYNNQENSINMLKEKVIRKKMLLNKLFYYFFLRKIY